MKDFCAKVIAVLLFVVLIGGVLQSEKNENKVTNEVQTQG